MRSTTSKHAVEALNRATTSQSVMNYGTIEEGFAEKGIDEEDIIPRENVFTFNAWIAKGRVVRKGQHGVKILTWIPVPAKLDAQGNEIRRAGKRPKTVTVFHVSQTEPLVKKIVA